MHLFRDRQKRDLQGLGLCEEQIAACEGIIASIPAHLDLKLVTNTAKLIVQAQSAIDKIEVKDPRFYHEITERLSSCVNWSPNLLSDIARVLNDVVTHQDGVHVSKLELDTNKATISVTTPKSKNFYRYDSLTALWKAWGREPSTSKESEFINFLTICLEDGFSLKGANRIRSHYLRYYQGQQVENSMNERLNDMRVEIKTTSNDKLGPVVMTGELNVPNSANLAKDLAKLKKKRS